MNKQSLLDRIKAFLYSSYMEMRVHCVSFVRWNVFRKTMSGSRVFYGYDHIPRRDEPASGGIVKCQDLQDVFPNCTRGANIMYLVSSALPHSPNVIARYAKKSGVKLVVNQNGVAIPAYHGDRIESINGPRRQLLKQADHVVYQSEYCKLTSDKYLTDTVKEYSILYNPVDTSFFRPKLNQSLSGTPVLLMTGSHHFFYRVASGVQLVSCLKKRGVRVVMKTYGRLAWKPDLTECEEELHALCREENVEDLVEIGKPYRQVDAPGIYQSADLFVHTKYKDPCPRAVVEGLACGLPVIYSDSGGVPELVGKEGGIGTSTPVDWDNIHPPDTEQMADAVEQILGSYSNFAEAARARAVTRFDVQDWLKAHKEIFDDLVAS